MRPSFLRSVGFGMAAAVMVVATAAAASAQQNVSSFSQSDPYGVWEYVFYVGLDHHVHEYASGNPLWDYDLTALTAPASVPVTDGSDLPSFSDGAGQHVFYVGVDEHVHHLNFPSFVKHRTWSDQDLTVISKSAPRVSAWGGWLPLVAFGDSTGEYVYYASMTNFHVHQLYWGNGVSFGNGATWIDRDLSTNVVGFHGACAGFAGFSHPDGEYMYYVSCLDNHVHQVYWNGSASSDQDLGIGAEGALTGFSNGKDRFLYFADGPTLGQGITLHQLLWDNQVEYVCYGGLCREYWWAWLASSDLPNAPLGVQPQTLTSFTDSTGVHVYYADEAYQVHQLDGTMGPNVPFTNPVSFVDQNLTKMAGGSAAPGVISCAHLSSFSDAAGEHVIYQGAADGQLHMLTFSNGQETDSVLTAGWVGPLSYLQNCTIR
jgi:hypothetical protein